MHLCVHHLQQAGTQGGHRDYQLREVAEGRIEKAADGGSGMDGDLLRSLNDGFGERHDGDRGTEEDESCCTLPPELRRAARGAKIKSHKREGRSSVRAACGTRLAEGTSGIIVLPRRGTSTRHRGEGRDLRYL